MPQSGYMCDVNVSAADVVNTTLNLMTYNNDGESYSHTFTVNKAGPISIFIYVYENTNINAVYYSNTNWAGTGTAESWNNFNIAQGPNDQLAGGTTPNFSYEFDTYIKGPITGTVNFEISHDDGIEFTIDGTLQPFSHDQVTTINGNLGAAGWFFANFSYTMTQDQLYRFQVKWNNPGGNGDRMLWYWDYTGQSQTIIPSTSYYLPVSTGPTQINSLCPTGYSPDANYDCVEV